MNPDDNLPLMMWHARPDMACEHVNRAWLEFTGYTLEQALGDGWSRALHPEDLARWLDTCVRAFDERRPFEIEYRLRRRDGDYRWVLDRAAPRYADDGVFVGYGGACVDIEDQKRSRESLARALSVLPELRSRAQAIAAGAGELRARVPAASDTAQALEAIEGTARGQDRLISSLLDLEEAARDSSAEKPVLSGVRVLVVDPARDAHEGVVRPLEVAGADVRVTASTREALHALGAWRPDVILTESDEAFIRALRALPAERGGSLRAAAITEASAGSVAPGYDARLAKPVEPVALLATVARLAA